VRKRLQICLVVLIVVGFVGLLVFLAQGHTISVLEPKGVIADKQRNLIYFAAGLSLIVVIPVFALLFYIIWKYRATNTKAQYSPDWDSNRTLETIWWGIPIILILILSVVTWNSTHDLDPFKPLVSDKKPPYHDHNF
jgi:cytochrome o ubiquinol oxidase subunit 2